MDLLRPTTNHSHVFTIWLFVLLTTACASPDSASTDDTSTVSNATATLSWDASVGPDVAGYKIYQATASGAFGAPVATVAMDVTSHTVTGLESGNTYFFVVTAYNSDGTESSFSNEANKSIP